MALENGDLCKVLAKNRHVAHQGSPMHSRRTHHERKKEHKFNTSTVRPEPLEGQLSGVLQVSLVILPEQHTKHHGVPLLRNLAVQNSFEGTTAG